MWEIPHRLEPARSNPAGAKDCWTRGRPGQLGLLHSRPPLSVQPEPFAPRRPAKIDNDSPDGATRCEPAASRWRALKSCRASFRPKPVRRTQRRSGGLVDGLEGRTPDVEAPAELTTAALDGDVREPEEPFSVYRSGQAGEA
jgi:hypothetical protein